jgi:hypothetical protein
VIADTAEVLTDIIGTRRAAARDHHRGADRDRAGARRLADAAVNARPFARAPLERVAP